MNARITKLFNRTKKIGNHMMNERILQVFRQARELQDWERKSLIALLTADALNPLPIAELAKAIRETAEAEPSDAITAPMDQR